MLLSPTDSLSTLRNEFSDSAGYLAACTAGLLADSTRRALLNDMAMRPDPLRYGVAVEEARCSFARISAVSADSVAIAAQTSAAVSIIATALPDDAVVLCPTGDFSSLVLPFVHAGRGITVRTAPLEHLASEVSRDVDLVAFSLVQSATGDVADADTIAAAARRHGVRTLCDTTQAAGWMPYDGSAFDAVVCHAYKWLCAPRGVAFLALNQQMRDECRPVQAGWYAGEDPWTSCYGTDAQLATSARRFDVSPAWQAFAGAAPILGRFAETDAGSTFSYVTALAARFRDRCGLPQPALASAIVTWPDATGDALARLRRADVTASGRAGRARVGFHIFNDDRDVEAAARALGY